MDQDKKRVLIVDDDPAITSIFEFILQQVGYEAITAKSHQDCLGIIQQSTSIDLVFLDIKLKHNEELATFKEIQALTPRSIIVMMSNYTTNTLLKKALDQGAYGIIYKPFDVEEVVSIIEEIFNLQKQ